jgi:multiple sugar transport system ATP-binding protein
MTMADRIVIMREGRVEQTGTPLELYDYPASQFVAGFIGSPSMNFLSGSIDQNGFVTASGLRLPLQSKPPIPAGQPVVYGIRPENLHLSADGVPFTVVVVEPTGAETQIVVRNNEDEIMFTLRDRVLPRRGETIRLRPDVARTHLFDAQTGAAIRFADSPVDVKVSASQVAV